MAYDEQSLRTNFADHPGDLRVARITRIYSDSFVCTGEDFAPFVFDLAGKPVPEVGHFIIADADGGVTFAAALPEPVAEPAA